MSSKVNLYTEIASLKRQNDELNLLASKVPILEDNLNTLTTDCNFYKEKYDDIVVKMKDLEKTVFNEQKTKYELKKIVTELTKEKAESDKLVLRLKSDLKFDKMAREGQVKRSHILEHELTETLHSNKMQSKLRLEAENRSQTTFVSLQRERALRLQGLHEKNKVLELCNLKSKNERYAEYEMYKTVENAKVLEGKVSGLEGEVLSQVVIISENDDELNEHLEEIKKGKLATQKLRIELQDAKKEALHHVEARTSLEQECYRLQTELITTRKSSARPQSMASSRGKFGLTKPQPLSLERATAGKTRPETTSEERIRRRQQELKSSEFSRTFTQSRERRGGYDNGTVLLDDAFFIPLNAAPIQTHKDSSLIGTSPMTGSRRFNSSNSGTQIKFDMTGETSLSSSQGSRNQSNSSPPKSALRKSRSRNSARNTNEFLDPLELESKCPSTVNVPGSLFLGSGLGLKKGMF